MTRDEALTILQDIRNVTSYETKETQFARGFLDGYAQGFQSGYEMAAVILLAVPEEAK